MTGNVLADRHGHRDSRGALARIGRGSTRGAVDAVSKQISSSVRAPAILDRDDWQSRAAAVRAARPPESPLGRPGAHRTSHEFRVGRHFHRLRAGRTKRHSRSRNLNRSTNDRRSRPLEPSARGRTRAATVTTRPPALAVPIDRWTPISTRSARWRIDGTSRLRAVRSSRKLGAKLVLHRIEATPRGGPMWFGFSTRESRSSRLPATLCDARVCPPGTVAALRVGRTGLATAPPNASSSRHPWTPRRR